MVDTIKRHAGLALPEQVCLPETFSEYLAHYAILKELHESVSEGRPAQNYTVGYYPRHLNKLVDAGFKQVTDDIREWDNQFIKIAANAFVEIGKDSSGTVR